MSEIADRVAKPIDPATSNVIRQAITLLKEATAEELGDIQARLVEEQNRRLEKAERELESMRKVFGRPLPLPSAVSPASISTSMKKPAARSGGSKATTKSGKAKSRHRETRAPRGQSKELILAFLSAGPKYRQQIADYFREKGLATESISTLLNRLKKANVIVYNAENKLYYESNKTTDKSEQS